MKPKTTIIAILAFTLALAGCKEKTLTADTPAQGADYADFPESLPPLPRERLEKILAEVVQIDDTIVSSGEEDGTIIEEKSAYSLEHGNTFFVNINEESPYYYERIKNPEPKKRNAEFHTCALRQSHKGKHAVF